MEENEEKHLINKFRDCVADKNKTKEMVIEFITEAYKDIKNDDKAAELLKFWSQNNVLRNVEIIFKYSESEIEKIFLNALNLSAFMVSPFLLVFTPKLDSAEEIISNFRKRDNMVMTCKKQYEKFTKKRDSKSFLDWLKQQDMPDEEKKSIEMHVMMYHESKLKESYHVSMQASFKEIKVLGKNIRPDIFIWVPSRPDFKLIVECDGYKYHSDKESFSKDRARDRQLQISNYKVFRFSGTEIFHDPVSKSFELCKYLSDNSTRFK